MAMNGDQVAVHYTGTLDDGSEFDSSEGRAPIEFTVGSGQVIAGFDEAVRGLAVGDSRTVRIEPENAYGDFNPELIVTVPIDQAPEGLQVGQQVQFGGGIAVVTELTTDSVTVDVHKWLSAPMGAGLFLTRHEGTLLHAFEVANEYMPREATQADSYDLYQRSLQWSRRFYGLKVFLSLLIHGWEGYEGAIREMMATGGYLRESLSGAGWRGIRRAWPEYTWKARKHATSAAPPDTDFTLKPRISV